MESFCLSQCQHLLLHQVTIARAIELKHNAALISALANETAKMYVIAADSISSLNQVTFGRWRMYFLFKSKFYFSKAYCYMGENLLSQDKCGESIRSLQESKKCYNEALNFAKEYAKSKGKNVISLMISIDTDALFQDLESRQDQSNMPFSESLPFLCRGLLTSVTAKTD